MQKSILPIFLLIALSQLLHAQDIKTWIQKAEQFYNSAMPDSAMLYSKMAIEKSTSTAYTAGILQGTIIQINLLIDEDKLEDAEINAKVMMGLAQKANDKFAEAIVTMQVGQAKMYGGSYTEALPYFETAIQKYFSKNPSREAALAYNDYAFAYGQLHQYEKETENLLKALRIHEQLNPINHAEMAMVLNNLSIVHLNLGQRENAIAYAKESLKHRELSGDIEKLALGYCNLCQMYRGVNSQEADKYRELCLKYSEQSGSEDRMVHSFITSALLYNDNKDLVQAIAYEQKAVDILEKNNNNPVMLSRRYLAMAMHAIVLNKDSATTIGYLNKSRDLARQIGDRATLREIYAQYYHFYKKEGEFEKALDNYRSFIGYRDSIVTENTKSNIAELETRYETEKKDNEILRLADVQRIKQLQIEKQNAIIAGNLLEAQKKQSEIELLSNAAELQNLRIQQQDEELIKQKLLAKTTDQALLLNRQETEIKERQLKESRRTRTFILMGAGLLGLLAYFLFNRYQLKQKLKEQHNLLTVRSHIAKDLHDEIGSTLTSIKILSETGRHQSSEKTLDNLQKIADQSAAAQQGISDIVWAMKPENEKLQQIIIRLREYIAHTLERKNIHTEIHVDETLYPETLGMQQRRDFLLICKEALHNIAKYADATKVELHFYRESNFLVARISDNGVGFDTEKQRSGSGLKNMAARAKALHANLDITSSPGNAVTITLRVPLA